MNIDPILQAPLAIQVHLATVLPAFAIGTWQIFFSTKGARWHRALGFVYLALMTITGGCGLFRSQRRPRVAEPDSSLHPADVLQCLLRAVERAPRQHRRPQMGDAGTLLRRTSDRRVAHFHARPSHASARLWRGALIELSTRERYRPCP